MTTLESATVSGALAVVLSFFVSFISGIIMLCFWNYTFVNAISICTPIEYWDAYWLSYIVNVKLLYNYFVD